MKTETLLSMFIVVALTALPAFSQDMQVQIKNDLDFPAGVRFFSKSESKAIYPARNKAYTVQPAKDAQSIALPCVAGEQVCWGGWATIVQQSQSSGYGRSSSSSVATQLGVGDRGHRICESCCFVCTHGGKTPVLEMSKGVAENSGNESPGSR